MNIMKTIQQALAQLALLCLLVTPAAAQVEIDISGAKVRGIPIAIVPFKTADGQILEHQVHEIIANDLNASGKFESIPVSDFLSFPFRDEEVRFKDWRQVNAEILVIGEVWLLDSNKYEVQFRMYDVARQQEIGAGKRITNLNPRDLRTAAHVVSDTVYESFLNRPGAYQSRIAYVNRSRVENQRYRYKLMVADWDGYGANEVFASWKPLLSPSWSPDGKKLAFVGYASKGPIIQMIDLTTMQTKTVASFPGVNSAPAWSPDGTKIAYSTSRHGNPDVYIYHVSTGQHERINSHYGIDTEPAWSPQGDSLLFTSSRTGKPQIYQYRFADSSATRVTFEGDENANGTYDFEGRNIALVHDGGKIVVMGARDGRMNLLTNSKYDESPSFSPNGDMVLYKTEQGYQPALMVASSDGRVRTRLEHVSGDVREPAWSPLRK